VNDGEYGVSQIRDSVIVRRINIRSCVIGEWIVVGQDRHGHVLGVHQKNSEYRDTAQQIEGVQPWQLLCRISHGVRLCSDSTGFRLPAVSSEHPRPRRSSCKVRESVGGVPRNRRYGKEEKMDADPSRRVRWFCHEET